MGDVPLIASCLIGSGVVYTILLVILMKNTKATPRPDLEEGEGKE